MTITDDIYNLGLGYTVENKKKDNESKVIYDTEYLSFENIHNENDLKLFSYIDRTTQYNKEMKLRMLEKIKYDFKGIRTIESLVKNEYSVEENKDNEKNKSGFLFKILEFIKKIFRGIINFFKTIIDKVIGFFKSLGGNNNDINKNAEKYKKDKELFDRKIKEYKEYSDELINLAGKYSSKMDKHYSEQLYDLMDYVSIAYIPGNKPEDKKVNPMLIEKLKNHFGSGIAINGEINVRRAIELLEMNLKRNKYNKEINEARDAEIERRIRNFQRKQEEQRELRKQNEEMREKTNKMVMDLIDEYEISMKCSVYNIKLKEPLLKLFDQFKISSKNLSVTVDEFNKITSSLKNYNGVVEYSLNQFSDGKKLSESLNKTLGTLEDLDNFYCKADTFENISLKRISSNDITNLESELRNERVQLSVRESNYNKTKHLVSDIIERLLGKNNVSVYVYNRNIKKLTDVFPLDDAEKNKQLAYDLSEQILQASVSLKSLISEIEQSNNNMINQLEKIINHIKSVPLEDYRGEVDVRHETYNSRSIAMNRVMHFNKVIDYFLSLVKYYSSMFSSGVKAYNFLSKEIVSYKKIASKL